MMSDQGLRRSVHHSINNYPYYADIPGQANLQASCKNSLDYVQRMDLLSTLNVHSGCVNTVNWNASGTHIVSGSDDNHLVITEASSGLVAVKTKTQHKRHIFSARFMPFTNDQAVVSCSGEGIVIHTEFLAPYGPGKNIEEAFVDESQCSIGYFDCHTIGSTYDVQPLPDSPRMFLSCGEDGTVRCIDLRITSRCVETICDKHIYITAPCAVTAMDIAQVNHYKVAIGCSDSIVRLYDRRMLSTVSDLERITHTVKAYPIPMKFTRRHYRPTCVKFSPDETDLLVSYSMEQIYLFNLLHPGFNDTELLKSGCYTPKLRRDDDNEQQMPRLRFRGDWSDTGPNSMTNAEQGSRVDVGQARPPLEPGVLSRLSDEIFRMLNSQTRHPRAVRPNITTHASPRTSSVHLSWQDAVVRTLDNQNETTSRSGSRLLNRVRNAAHYIESLEAHVPPAVSALPINDPTTGAASTNSEQGDVAMGEASDSDENRKYMVTTFDYIKMSYRGHRNSRTMVKGACFWGDDYVMSGSDCGHIFVWDRKTGKVVKTMLADHRVVNRVQPHPTLPYLLSSGIDYNVKVWAPIGPEPIFDEKETTGLIKSNEIMLVETRDTITVPAPIMIRILASLHQYRRLMHTTGDPALAATAIHRPHRGEVVLRTIRGSEIANMQAARTPQAAQTILAAQTAEAALIAAVVSTAERHEHMGDSDDNSNDNNPNTNNSNAS